MSEGKLKKWEIWVDGKTDEENEQQRKKKTDAILAGKVQHPDGSYYSTEDENFFITVVRTRVLNTAQIVEAIHDFFGGRGGGDQVQLIQEDDGFKITVTSDTRLDKDVLHFQKAEDGYYFEALTKDFSKAKI